MRSHRRTRSAVVGVVAVAAGLCVAVPAEAITQKRAVGRSVVYACTFPSGKQQVTVRFAGAFPKAGRVGKPVTSGTMHITLTLPPVLTGELAKLGATAVSGALRLTTLVTLNGSPAPVTSPNLLAPAVAISATTPASLSASGQGPGVTVAVPGNIGFLTGDISGTLTLQRADGAAVSPAQLSFSCTPDLGQNTTLATVAVGSTGSSNIAHPNVRATAQEDYCPPVPTGDLSGDFPPPTRPPGVMELPTVIQPGCAKVNGFSNISKLNGAAAVSGKAGLLAGIRQYSLLEPPYDPDHDFYENDSIAHMYLDTTEATFLAFGFMPTTAKVDIIQVGKTTAYQNANITALGFWINTPDRPLRFITASAYVEFRVHDVRINGVPLDVGPSCHTAEPVMLQVTANNHQSPSYSASVGGDLRGTVTIPAFSGCGVGEDLDPLFNASISGPGNFVKVTQGQLCGPDAPLQPGSPCPMQDFGWTFTPGGTFTGIQTDRITFKLPTATISCDSTWTSSIPSGSVVDGSVLGTENSSMQLSNCVGTGVLSGDIRVLGNNFSSIAFATYDPATNMVTGEFGGPDPTFRYGTRCTIALINLVGFRYSNETHQLELKTESSAPLRVGFARFCDPSIHADDPVITSGHYSVDPPQRFTRPYTR